MLDVASADWELLSSAVGVFCLWEVNTLKGVLMHWPQAKVFLYHPYKSISQMTRKYVKYILCV